MRGHRVANLWGRGLFASADMMSLEATRYLWAARLDPRRRTYAVGTYAHVLDQWGIFYDQPIVLNRRQAGPAIEGALRQQHVDRIERVAVDTHGFTHFAMALAKLVGFDLCPRLAKLKKRKLYLPRGLDVPDALQPCVAETVSRRAIARGWEGLLRLAVSVKHGWYPATEALDRFGSAAAGDPVYEAGDALGKLLRTLYLCDYFGNPGSRHRTGRIARGLYQPKTAIADLMVMPPVRVRRISRPTAARKTCGNWSAGGTRDQRVRTLSRPCRVRRMTSPSATRCDQRKPISWK